MPPRNQQPPVYNQLLGCLICVAYTLYGQKFKTFHPDGEWLTYLVNTVLYSRKIIGLDQNWRVDKKYCSQALRSNPGYLQNLTAKNVWAQCDEWGIERLLKDTLSDIMYHITPAEFEDGLDQVDDTYSPMRPNIPAFIEGLPSPEAQRERNVKLGILNQEYTPVPNAESIQSPGMETLSSGYDVNHLANHYVPVTDPHSNQTWEMTTGNSGYDVGPVAYVPPAKNFHSNPTW